MLKYSADKVVAFLESDHSYTRVSDGYKLESVTTYLGRHENKFDEAKLLPKTAKKHGLYEECLKYEWTAKVEYSCLMGSYLHKMFEFQSEGKELRPLDYFPKSHIAKKLINDYYNSGRLTAVHSELIVYNKYLAGQIDRIDRDAKGNLYINDFKTNGKLEKENFGKFMLGELAKFGIPDSKYHRYSLQLSIYKILFQQEIKAMYIIYISDVGYHFIPAIDYSEQLLTLDTFK